MQAGPDVADEGEWNGKTEGQGACRQPKAKEHAADERGKLEARLRHERLIQQPEFQSLFVSQQHHQCMSSNGKSVTAHTDARAQVGRKSVFFVGEVEDQDQQARSNENQCTCLSASACTSSAQVLLSTQHSVHKFC